jgi:hypothetical protein
VKIAAEMLRNVLLAFVSPSFSPASRQTGLEEQSVWPPFSGWVFFHIAFSLSPLEKLAA